MNLKKYIAFFRLRLTMSLQYRAAALAGVATQFAWGFLLILAFHAFYRSNPEAFPMTMDATVSYIWMQQAFLSFYMLWLTDREILDSIQNGGIAYELCRPIDLYAMWSLRNFATRLSRGLLRCVPILAVAFFLPEGYRLALPTDAPTFLLFLFSTALGVTVAVGITVLAYIITLLTLQPQGIRLILVTASDFLSGGLIPLPFFPDGIREFCEALPFAAVQNVPLRVYSGDLAGRSAALAVGLQVFWAAVLILLGYVLMQKSQKRVIVQGG